MNDLVFAFGLTMLAGLSTGIGSIIAFISPNKSPRYLSVLLGFSAGVMIYVSMIEIFPKAQAAIALDMGDKSAMWITTAGFFGGIAVIALIDKLVPHEVNPHEVHHVPEDVVASNGPAKTRAAKARPAGKGTSKKGLDGPGMPGSTLDNDRLLRMGVFTALAIAIHNFPEGFATFLSALQDPKIAIPIAIAIALHNIPEGIAVSVPIYYATGSRSKAFWLSFASGLAEPVGALVGYLLLRPYLSDTLFGISFAGVAGIMVYISLDELLPTAEEYGEHHLAIGGLIAGMAVMALSLLLLA